MGSYLTKGMEENFKKQQDFMLQSQRMQMERQIQMQNLMREKMMATQLGRSREMFNWVATGYTTLFIFCLAGFRRTKNPAIIGPLLPLGFVVGYQADLAYGNKLERIRIEADRILAEEGSLLELAGGPPTINEIDKRRSQQLD